MKVSKNTKGEPVSISRAVEGDEYFCVDCGAKMFAKNKKKEGRKREIHFAHYSDSPCSGNLETYLHKAAKLIIDNERKIILPRLGNIEVQNTSIEKGLHSIVPDILITDQNNCDIIIEIFVRHKTDETKIAKIKKINIPAFEIDLSTLSYDSEYETIRFEVIENLLNKFELNPPIEIKEIEPLLKIKVSEANPILKETKSNTWPLLIAAIAFFVWLFNRKKNRRLRRH